MVTFTTGQNAVMTEGPPRAARLPALSIALPTAVILASSALPALGQTEGVEPESPAVTATATAQATTAAPVTESPPPAPSAAQSAPAAAPEKPAVAGTVNLVPPSPPPEPCPERKREAAEGFGQFLLGAGFFGLKDLQDRLAANGYDRLPTAITILGGEGHGVFDSGFLVGVRGAALLSPESEGPRGFTASVGGGFGMVDFGFALVHTRPILLSLAAGIGGFGYSIDIGDGASAPFDDALADPARSTSISTGGVLGSLTAGFDGRVDVGQAQEGRQGFFTLGLRLGVLYGPPIGDWSLSNGGAATGGPSTELIGGYGALAIGFGGRRDEPPKPFD